MAEYEPASDDVKEALRRQEKKRDAVKAKQDLAKRDELAKMKSGDVKYNYIQVFESEIGQSILDDLKKYCFYDESAYNDSDRQILLNLGKNQVIHYILEKLKPKDS